MLKFLRLLVVCCCINGLFAAAAWQAAEEAVKTAQKDLAAGIDQLQSLLLDDPDLHVAHYNLGCLLLNYQWQAEDDQRFGEQTRTLAKQALDMSQLPDIDPLALAAEHFKRASESPVLTLSARAWHNLALARYKQARLKEALAAAVQACDIQQQNQSYLQTRNELRRVYLQRLDEARLKAETEAKRLRLVTTALPFAFVGKTYSGQLQAKGGAGQPYQFSVSGEQTLPSDLQLNASGLISGMPNTDAIGEHELKLMVKDQADASDENNVRLKVWPLARISTDALPEAIIQQSYQAQLQCEGFPNPKWFVDGLPPGISLKSDTGARVLLHGVTDKVGSYQINMTVRDDHYQLIAVQSLVLEVTNSFTPDTSKMPAATAFAPYHFKLGVRGPTQSYTFFSQGAGGLHVDQDGVIAGQAEAAGELELPLTITAADKTERSFLLSVTVNPPPIIDEEERISLRTGEVLQRTLKVKGGTAPYTWTLKDGLLPEGVRLETDGTISGAARASEEAPVTISVTDRWQSRSHKDIVLEFKTEDPQQQQQEQQQAQQEQQQQQQNQDQQNQAGQQGQDQQQAQQQQQGEQQQGKQQQQQAQQNQELNGSEQSAAEQAAAAQEQQAAHIKQADVQRWLDNLPEESKRALLMQMLSGKQQEQTVEEPW